MPQRFLHEVLLRARLELGLTQEELAASVGADVRTYRRYESGEVNEGGFSIRQPARRKLLARLGDELGLRMEDLVTEDAPVVRGEFAPEIAATLQRAPFFVGREALLEDLLRWIGGERGPGVISLVGVGGAGKTAVAERLLGRIEGGARAGGLFVWSFYDDERAEVFLRRAADYFCRASGGGGEGSGRLEDALGDGAPHLLVLDGLELVQEDGRGTRAHGELADPLLRRLLVALARGLGRARALVTSRFVLSDLAPWEGDGAQTIRLAPLTPQEAERLLCAWGAKADPEALRGVIASSGGHALSLAVAGSYAGAFLDGDLRSLAAGELAEAAHDDPQARRLARILSTYAGAMPALERDLMARLSVLPSGADEAALAALAGASPRVAGALTGASLPELRRALVRLERLGLLFRAGEQPPRWSSHPFVRDHFRALLGVAPAAVQSALTSPPEGTLIFAPRQKPGDRGRLDAFEEVIEQLLSAGQVLDAFRVYTQALGGFNHLGLVLGEMSRGARVLRRFGEPADEHAPLRQLAPDWRGFLLYERGLFAGALGDLAYACRCYELHTQLAEQLQDPHRVTTGLRTRAYTERLQGQLLAAQDIVERSLSVAEAHDLGEHQLRALALRASILHDRGDIAAARAEFARLQQREETGVARRGLWHAEHLIALGALEEAFSMTERNVEACERLRWAGHAAHGRVLLGLSLISSDLPAAGRMLESARGWALSSGEVEMQARVHELAGRLALARGSLFEAAREAASGERLAETCRLGIFRARFVALGLSVALARGDDDGMARASEVDRLVLQEDAWGHAEALHHAALCLENLREGALARKAAQDALRWRERLGHPGREETRVVLARLGEPQP